MGMVGNYRGITQEKLAKLQSHPESITPFLFPGYQADEASELDFICVAPPF